MSTTRSIARRLARGQATAEETRELVRTVLLEARPEDFDDGELEPEVAADEPWLSDGALERIGEMEVQVEAERRAAEEGLAALLVLPAGARLAAFDSDPRLAGWPLVDLLCERSFAAGPERPGEARQLARLAVELAGRLDDRTEGEDAVSAPLRADLRGMAWAQLGNAERIASDLPAAEAALKTAEEHLRAGTGDRLMRARYLGFAASLGSDRSRFERAVELARRSAGLYRRLDDRHGLGRTLLKLASYHAHRDDLDRACATIDEALAHLDPEEEPRSLFVAHQNRASFLERAGRLDEAEGELAAAEELAAASLDRLRIRWIAGRIAVRRGETASGERELTQVRAQFLDRDLGYEAAQVSLELAVLYAEQDRIADQKRLAEEMVPLFAARGVHPEARAALTLFCDAVRREAASAALARAVADYLDRAEGRPGLVFRPDSQ